MTKRRKASNWVNRDEPLEEKLVRILAYQYDLTSADPALLEWASVIRGMVEADASEVQLAAFLGTLPVPARSDSPSRRLLAIALWHVAKCGLVRDAADRRISELMVHQPMGESMGEFLARAVANAPNREQYQPPPGTPQPKRRS